MNDFERAKAQAQALLEPFRPAHPRIKVFVGFDVDPAIWRDCPHVETPEEALELAQGEDSLKNQRESNPRRSND